MVARGQDSRENSLSSTSVPVLGPGIQRTHSGPDLEGSWAVRKMAHNMTIQADETGRGHERALWSSGRSPRPRLGQEHANLLEQGQAEVEGHEAE